MLLKSIELSGFKSFAKKSGFSFKNPITAIVGPNGSGKSNVAESFRFVLGEQSIKSLRGKRGEDLIWNGNGDVPKANRASVKIIFDNEEKFFDIDFPEVTLERIVHRDGTNEYRINGSLVRLKDIVELLAKANIGSTGHHIISQGEADRILSATVKERKGMVEESLGLTSFQYKKEESIKKLSKTKENIEKVTSLRREIAPHIKFLKKQVEKIEKAEELRKELREKYSEYLAREALYLEREEKELKDSIEPQEKELQELDTRIEALKKLVEKSRGEGDDSRKLIQCEEDLRETLKEKEEIMLREGKLIGEKESMERLLHEEERAQEREETKTVELTRVKDMMKDIETSAERASSLADFMTLFRDLSKKFFDSFITHAHTARMKEFEARIKELLKDIEETKKSLLLKEKEVTEKRSLYEHVRKTIEEEKDTKKDAEKEVYILLADRQEKASILHDLHMRKERVSRDRESFVREIEEGNVLIGKDILGYKEGMQRYTEEERGAQEERRKIIEKIKIRLEDMGGGGSSDVLHEYKQATERDEFLLKELEDLETTVVSLEKLIGELEEELATRFRQGLEKINLEFNNFFSMMFGGGKAGVSLVREQKRRRKVGGDDLDIEDGGEEGETEEGVEVDVSLPRKRIKGLMMLSGGERALTSIALLFAISQVNPPPFIILDETDAALDEANSKKYGDMVEGLASRSQLILITHNRETMSRAGNIYGVTMGGDGVSKLLSISFDEASVVAK